MVGDQQFDGRGHFFAAAAEAMRRSSSTMPRRNERRSAATGRRDWISNRTGCRAALRPRPVARPRRCPDPLRVDNPAAAGLAKLRFFGGLSVEAPATHSASPVQPLSEPGATPAPG